MLHPSMFAGSKKSAPLRAVGGAALLAAAAVVGTRMAPVAASLGLLALLADDSDDRPLRGHLRRAGAFWSASAIALAWMPVSLWEPFSPHGAVAVWLGLSVYNALYPSLALVLATWLRRRGARWVVVLPVAILLAESARASPFAGLDWLSLGYLGADTPVAQHLFGVVGVHGVSAAIAVIAGLGADLRASRARAWPAPWIAAVVLSAIPCPCEFGGTAPRETLAIGVPLVDDLWRWQGAAQELADHGVPLILGPEGLAASARHVPALGAEILVGYVQACPDDDTHQCYENGASLHGQWGQGLAELLKRRGVPLYESAFGPFAVEGRREMRSGTGDGVVEAAGVRVGVVICFEVLFAEFLDEAVRGDARWIAHLTSDTWQAASFGVSQHLRIAQVRAAELGISVLRASRGGPSVTVDPHGRAGLLAEDRPGADSATVQVDLAGRRTPLRGHTDRVGEMSAVLLELANIRAYTRGHVALRELNILAPDVPASIGQFHIRAPTGQRGVVFYVCSRPASTATSGASTPGTTETVDPVDEPVPTRSTPAETQAAEDVQRSRRYPPGECPLPKVSLSLPAASSHSRWGIDLSLGAVAAAFNTRYWSPGALLGIGVSVTELAKSRGLLTLRVPLEEAFAYEKKVAELRHAPRPPREAPQAICALGAGPSGLVSVVSRPPPWYLPSKPLHHGTQSDPDRSVLVHRCRGLGSRARGRCRQSGPDRREGSPP